MLNDHSSQSLTDEQLLDRLDETTRCERRCQVAGIQYLAEVESRRLHHFLGYRSLFEFCVQRLKWSEGSVYRRVQIVRVALQVPALLEAIRSQRLTLTVASLIAPRLGAGMAEEMIARYAGLSRRQAEDLLAQEGRASARPSESIRNLGLHPVNSMSASTPPVESAPTSTPAPSAAPPTTEFSRGSGRMSSTPDSPREEIFSFRFCGNGELRDKILRAKSIMATKLESTAMEDVLNAALDCLLDKHDPVRQAARATAREEKKAMAAESGAKADAVKSKQDPDSRYISAATRRAVNSRSGHRCEWKAAGRRCTGQVRLEVDHIVPFAKGGKTELRNLQNLCFAHNQLKARLDYGNEKIDAAIGAGRPQPCRQGASMLKKNSQLECVRARRTYQIAAS